MANQGPSKRRRIETATDSRPATPLISLDRDISPPPRANSASAAIKVESDDATEDISMSQPAILVSIKHQSFEPIGTTQQIKDENTESDTDGEDAGETRTLVESEEVESTSTPSRVRVLPSPIQLTRIRDLPSSKNVDTVSLRDLIGDPMIKECWQFNYLLDLDFIMNHLDPDVRDLVRVNIVHGSWKTEDAQRIRLVESVKQYPNAKVIIAHMPEAFGTHHTKLMILIRHDDTAQIIIHTANMISQDWANLTQAVWRSPLLPLLRDSPTSDGATSTNPIGTGARFKFDFLRYLKAYSGRTKSLVDQLRLYDFTAIKAALVASTPSRINVSSANPAKQTSWGWPGLKEILFAVPCKQEDMSKQPNIVAQVSSIATLTEKWLENFIEVLSVKKIQGSSSFFDSKAKKPRIQVIFPTAEEIRQSLDGYASGSSIHMKLQSAVQQKQLSVMKPMFCHWMGDTMGVSQGHEHKGHVLGSSESKLPILPKREALRNTAAPHIKTYIRYPGAERDSIDWAMVTSANLSTQAWGALTDKDGSVRICSYELGVVVWPDLFQEVGDEHVRMLPTFGKDTPDLDEGPKLDMNVKDKGMTKQIQEQAITSIGFRMPYDLPLVPYKADDLPWCATSLYGAPDAFGRGWGGFKPR